MISLSHTLLRGTRARYQAAGAVGALLLLLLLLVTLGTPSFAFAATRSSQRSQQPLCVRGACFVHTTTASNTHGDHTVLDFVFPNKSPNAVVLASPALDFSNLSNVLSMDWTRIAVEYNAQLQRWLIVNEDGSPMPIGARFNVQAYGQAPDEGTFSLVTDAGNLAGNAHQVIIDNPLSNNNPDAVIFVTNQISQANSKRDPHTLGTRYESTTGQWVLFHEDGTPMKAGESYNFLISTNEPQYTQTVSMNTYGMFACLNNPSFNVPAATPIVAIKGTATVTDPIGMFYNPFNAEWCAFDMAIVPLPPNAQLIISNM